MKRENCRCTIKIKFLGEGSKCFRITNSGLSFLFAAVGFILLCNNITGFSSILFPYGFFFVSKDLFYDSQGELLL